VTGKYTMYKEMLNSLKRIDTEKNKTTKTFMEVSGYPHFENVASNILSFFFTSDEEHGLNDLFFRSLIEILIQEDSIQSHSVFAEREYATLKNNRIDIVLSNDTYVIGIENKLYSGVQNDLIDYKDTINKIAIDEDKVPLYVLLTLRDEKNIALSNSFMNVTYNELFISVKNNLGSYIESADNTWLIYLKDFMKTIYELQNGGDQMNRDLLNFINENSEMVGQLLNDCYWLKRELSQQTKNLSAIVELEKYKDNMKFNAFCYNPKVYVTSSFVVDINKGAGKILVIETYIDSAGWHIALWDRFGKQRGKSNLEKLLTDMSIKFHNYNNNDETDSMFIVLEDYDHEVPLGTLAESIDELMIVASKIEI